MALEAVVYPQEFYGSSLKDVCGYDFCNLLLECDHDQGMELDDYLGVNLVASSTKNGGEKTEEVVVERKRRRRARSCKNKEEVENQRMTHIAVERNRRKLMNEYLTVLRSIMPPGYVQRVNKVLSFSTLSGSTARILLPHANSVFSK